MFKKVAMTLGIIFLIGLVIIFIASAWQGSASAVWDWIFGTLFNMPIPPNPF